MNRKIAGGFSLSWHKTGGGLRVLFPLAIFALCFCSQVLAGTSNLMDLAAGSPSLQTPAPSGRIVVRLAPSSGLVMGRTGLTTRPGAKAQATVDARRLDSLIGSMVEGGILEKRIPTAEIRPRKSLGHGHVPDLALYAHLDVGTLDRDRLLRIMTRIAADPAVELAFLEPVAVPAALGFDAFTGATPQVSTPLGRVAEPAITPDFQAQQGYLNDAPQGVGALSMRSQAGATGAGLTVIDVEGAWLWAHEDLPTPYADIGVHIPDLSWRNHGTAVMGEMRGTDNGFGVTGIIPDCQIGASSVGANSVAGALAAAMDTLQPGDLILIELHAPGPHATGVGQVGYVPMEYWQDNFDVIRLATSRGIIVCEAAGNGYENLDNEDYLGLFDRTVRDSGAIMCGATQADSLTAAGFSNNGSRVDLNGWGWDVTTTGYGDLQNTGQEEEHYTAGFSGTSSASPIVTGAVASLQGMVRARHGFDLDARLARDLLLATGSPMLNGHAIGARPNLVAAFALADTGIGQVTGTVTDLATSLPLADVLVQIPGQGSFTLTAADGTYRLPLQIGATDIEFSSFYYSADTSSTVINPSATSVLDVALSALPLVDIAGVVYGGGVGVSGAVVTPVDQPVGGDTTVGDGSFSISGVPAEKIYTLRFDGVPGYGARIEAVSTVGATGTVTVLPGLSPIAEDFESDGGGFVSTSGLWTHGTPITATGGAFSGSQCWGIGMSGSGYLDDQEDFLQSPVYDLSAITASFYYLSFHFYSLTEVGFDGVNLQVWDGAQYSLIQPLDGYTDLSLGGLGNVGGWSGESGRWRGAVFDISAYKGGNFQFQLQFGSDAGVTGPGFFIDGITFGEGLVASSVHPEPLPNPTTVDLVAWPNPFNPIVNIGFSVPEAGHLQITVFDLRGRRVRTLLNSLVTENRGTVTWNGSDDRGNRVASGIYLVQLKEEAGGVRTRRIVLAK